MNTNSTKSQSILTGLLEFIYCFSLITLVSAIFLFLIFPKNLDKTPLFMFMLIFSVISYFLFIAIVHELVKINDTVLHKKPFVMDNIKRLKKIAVYLFTISAYIFVRDLVTLNGHLLAFFFNKGGLITDSEFLIFVLLGVFVLILANIFKSAIDLKNENDLTI